MGFIAAGYRTKDFRSVGSSNEEWVICRQPKVRRGSGRDEVRSGRHKRSKNRKRLIGIEDLPSELIQRIFVLSRNHQLCEVNKFFYACLRPTSFLLHRFIVENFYHDLNHEVGRNAPGDAKRKEIPVFNGLNGKVFENPVFVRFLKENHFLLRDVGHITHGEGLERLIKERETMFSNGDLINLSESHVAVTKQDYPPIFYEQVDLFFENDIQLKKPIYNQFILQLSGHYEIKEPYYLIEMSLQWFFSSTHQYNVNHLFHALNLISHVSVLQSNDFDNVTPLIQFISGLYIEPKSNIYVLLLLDDYVDDGALSSRRLRVLAKFIKKFYKNVEERASILSQDALWHTLSEIKEKPVMKVIMDYGGQPSFNVVQ